MPWTLSHPAAVLPLRRFSPRPLDFAALVVGSMTPDLGYYIDRFDLSTCPHPAGSFVACVPTGVIPALFYTFLQADLLCPARASPAGSPAALPRFSLRA